MRVNHEYDRGGALAYLAAYDVHRAHVIGLCADTTGIDRDAKNRRVFRQNSPAGDIVVVKLQPSDHSSAEETVFSINLGLVLGPKWESWFRRVNHDGEDHWCISDEQTFGAMSERARTRLDEVLPDLVRMLDRDWVFAEAPALFKGGAWRVRAWLLADRGPSEELERLLDEEGGRRSVPEQLERIREYARTRSSYQVPITWPGRASHRPNVLRCPWPWRPGESAGDESMQHR